MIVIDINCLAVVFSPGAAPHAEFRPVRDWIVNGDGKAVFGGSTYKRELSKTAAYLRLLLELKRARRAVEISAPEVDAHEAAIGAKPHPSGSRDFHIAAIVIASHCGLVCSQDKAAHKLLKDKSLYPQGCQRPKIYSQRSHESLLCARYLKRLLNAC